MVLSLSGIIKKKKLKFEDTKGGIGSLKSKKDRQHNGQKKKRIYWQNILFSKIRRSWRYQRGNQNPYVASVGLSKLLCHKKEIERSIKIWGKWLRKEDELRVSYFWHLRHRIWYCFDNYFTYFVPVFKYCYSDSRNLWTVMRAGGLAP